MSRYGPIWLEVARQQYVYLPADLRELVDRTIEQLLEDPTGYPYAVYNAASDQWSVPLAEHGFVFYAVVRDPARVIILRLVVLLG